MRLPASDSEGDGPNLTPVIDVVFLLLIFFLVATRLDEEERELDTRLPTVVQARPQVSGHKQIIVNISNEGKYTIEKRDLSPEQIEALLKEESLKNPSMQSVLIRADERVTFKYVARIMGICERQQVKHSCAVEQAKK